MGRAEEDMTITLLDVVLGALLLKLLLVELIVTLLLVELLSTLLTELLVEMLVVLLVILSTEILDPPLRELDELLLTVLIPALETPELVKLALVAAKVNNALVLGHPGSLKLGVVYPGQPG